MPLTFTEAIATKWAPAPTAGAYEAWLRRYYPKAVSKPMAYFHREFWEWLWKLELDKPHPDYDAGFGIWSRGCGKTTSGLLAVAAIGALKKRRYGWLLSRTQAQANQKLLTLRTSISKINTGFLAAYPHMAKARTVDGHNLGWNTQQLICGDDADRFVMESIGLDTAVRGANVEFVRPDFLMPDDIDVLHDSPYMVEKNIEILTRSILPAGSDSLAVLGLQNLIHQDSIFAQIADGRAKFLRKRKLFGDMAVPAFIGEFKVEERETDKGQLYFIVGGVPTWAEGFGIAEAEKELNEIDLPAFESECQHNVSKPSDDATFREFDPVYHCITVSEFTSFFMGRKALRPDYQPYRVEFRDGMASKFELPRGDVGMCQDWGNNIKHPCGTRWMWRPGEYQPLSDSVFMIREMCWPSFPPKLNDERANPSYGQLHKAIVEYEESIGIGLKYRKQEESNRMQFRLVSHERPEAAAAYAKDFNEPLMFEGIDTREAREGVLHVQEFLHIDRTQFHPFRIDPRTIARVSEHQCEICGWRHRGEHLQGRPRQYFVVADGQGELIVDKVGKLQVKPALDETGMARTRWEYPRHHPKHSTDGEEKDAPKRDDEMVDTDRAMMGRVYGLVKRLPEQERILLKYYERTQAQRQEAEGRGMQEEGIRAIIQTNLINQERELEKLGRQEHYLFADNPFA